MIKHGNEEGASFSEIDGNAADSITRRDGLLGKSFNRALALP